MQDEIDLHIFQNINHLLKGMFWHNQCAAIDVIYFWLDTILKPLKSTGPQQMT